MADAYRYPPFNNAKPEPIWSDDSDYFIPIVSSIGSGPKGDTFTYEDLSPQQITQIGEMAIAAGAKGDKGDKGDTGDPAGFDEITASVDNSIGTPSVVVTESGPNEAKNIDFAFHNLKGDTFTFDDLTQSQVDILRANIIGFDVRRYSLTYSDFYHISATSHTANLLPAYGDGSASDSIRYITLVFKNGLLLNSTEYEIEMVYQQGIGIPTTFENYSLYIDSILTESDEFEVIVVSLKELVNE